MKHISKKILALMLLSAVLYSPRAAAISKLDFFAPAEGISTRVEKIAKKVAEKYNKAMSDLEDKVMRGGCRESNGVKICRKEGNALYSMLKDQFEKDSGSIIDNVKSQVTSGNLDIRNILKNSIKATTQKYANAKLDLQTANYALADYKAALATERANKEKDINQDIMILKLKLETDEVKENKEAREQIVRQIADLEEQKAALSAEKSKRDAKAESMEKDIKNKAEAVAGWSKQLDEEQMKLKLDKASDALFDIKIGDNKELGDLFEDADEDEENKEVEEMYGADYQAFFLAKYEPATSENILRVRNKRKAEYYKALQNLMRVLIIGTAKGKNISDSSTAYLNRVAGGTDADGKTEVKGPEGIFGAMSMKIGADIQNAKVAARYTEMLLAEIRFNTMSDINLWNDKYKLVDYKKDFTKFNFDDYVEKKKSLKDKIKDKVNGGIQQGLNKFTGF